jgi:hypothetical protein
VLGGRIRDFAVPGAIVTARDGNGGSSREVKRLATIPRNQGREELRVSWDEFTPDRGEPSRYLSLRLWWKDDAGELHPGKKGITVRRGELETVHAALGKVLDGLHQQNGSSS